MFYIRYIHRERDRDRQTDRQTDSLYYRAICKSIKLVSAIFYQNFIFSPNDSPSKTVKNVFYFI